MADKEDRKGAFAGLLDVARGTPGEATPEPAAAAPAAARTTASDKKPGKSKDPAYTQISEFIKKSVRDRAKQGVLRERLRTGNMELDLSDIINQLLDEKFPDKG